MLRDWLFARAQKPPTHLGPAYWNSYRTDLAKLLIFYKDLNQRSIMENPANSVSGSLLRLSWVCDFAHLPGLREQSQTVGGPAQASRATKGQPGLRSEWAG